MKRLLIAAAAASALALAACETATPYQPIATGDTPFNFRLRTGGPAEAAWLDNIISTMQAAAARLQTADAAREVHNLIQEARAQERRGIRVPF